MSASSTVSGQRTKTNNNDEDACAHRTRVFSCEQQDLFDRMYGMCEEEKPTKNCAWCGFDHHAVRRLSNRPSKPSYPPEELDTDFKRNHPPDPFGDEVEPHARVWKIYRDEATAHDEPMVDLWNKTLDILLIFAGLFSAVETAFIVEAYRALLPDYDAYTAQVIYVFASFGNGSLPVQHLSGLADPSVVAVSNLSRWINGLWFMSLLFSLAVALLCILTKQWVPYYAFRVNSPSSSPQQWARRRSLYYEGLLRWHLPGLISTLPFLLHISLFVFLAGLVLFIWNLDRFIGMGLLTLTSTLLGFYMLCFIAPMWSIDSPTMSPILEQLTSIGIYHNSLRWLMKTIQAAIHRAFYKTRVDPIDYGDDDEEVISPSGAARVSLAVQRAVSALYSLPRRIWFTLQDLWNMRSAYFYRHYIGTPIWNHIQRIEKSGEKHALNHRAAELDAATISWLVRSSSNDDSVLVALQATGSLHPASRGTAILRDDPGVKLKAVDVLYTAFYAAELRCGTVTSISPADIARLLRVALAQTPFLLQNRGLGYPWSTAAVRDYDLYLLSQIFTPYAPNPGNITKREVHFIHPPRGLGGKSPFLHSTVLLLLGRRSLSLEPQLVLVDLLDFSRITDEDARYITTALIPRMEWNRHTHTHSFPCNCDCLLDVLSDIALKSAYSASKSSCHRSHSMSLVLIRRLLRLQPKSFRARSDRPQMYLCTASTPCCIGLVVPHFLDLLTSGLYTGSTELEWYGAASFLSSALDYYGSTRISPIRCQQILCIITATLRLIPPHETRDFDPPHLRDNLLLEMCSVVYALYRPISLFMYRAKGRASLYHAQLQVAHDIWSINDGLLPLLKRTEDTPSIWSVIVSSYFERHTTAVSLVLAIQLCSGARRGLVGISSLIAEFFAYNWGLDALRGNSSGVRSDSEAALLHLLIQHCVELKSDWWENVRARVHVGDVTSESGGGKILHVDPRGAEWRRRDVRYYDRWLAKQRHGPCTMCAACEPPVAPPV